MGINVYINTAMQVDKC